MKVKIVATIGPASGDLEVQKEMVEAGLSVARFNFSHGQKEEFKEWAQNFRSLSSQTKQPVAILQDLQGPRLRLGELKKEKTLSLGEVLKVGVRRSGNDLVLDNPEVFADIKPKERILVNDGVVVLRVKEKKTHSLICEVERAGKVRSHSGVNLPDSKISLPSLTEKDKEDALFGLELRVDYMALSFVRKADDIREFKKYLDHHSSFRPLIIAKIEKREAVENIEGILKVVDGIMVARGDLGIEMPREEVPLVQKELIKKAIAAGKTVITATQMLESMVKRPLPTRAEVSDVANAILDGTDAVMLSEETSIGDYPVEALKEMAKVIKEVEEAYDNNRSIAHKLISEIDVLGEAACRMAQEAKARYIVSVTNSGHTARMIAKHRPKTPILALTPYETVWRQLNLVWGVTPLLLPMFHTTDELIYQATNLVKTKKLVKPKDKIIIVAGHPAGKKGRTNLLKLQII